MRQVARKGMPDKAQNKENTKALSVTGGAGTIYKHDAKGFLPVK